MQSLEFTKFSLIENEKSERSKIILKCLTANIEDYLYFKEYLICICVLPACMCTCLSEVSGAQKECVGSPATGVTDGSM